MKYYLLFLILLSGSLKMNAQMIYPESRKENVVDNYHGTKVADPYRWLEDDNSEETKSWVKQQNLLTFGYLEKIPFRQKIRNRLEEIWNFPKYSSPSKEGSYYYFFKNDGLQNQSVLYRQKGLNGESDVFIDPNTLSKEGIAALGSLNFSHRSKYCAYTVNKAGSDWSEGFVMDVESKKLLNDKIEWIKFSGLSWKGDEGFFYSRYPKPDESAALSGQNQFHKVYYHKIGTPQEDDVLVFEDKDNPLQYHFAFVTEDQQYLILNKSKGTSGSEILAKKISDGLNAPFKLIFKGFEFDANVFYSEGDILFVQTNKSAPNFKVVGIPFSNPEESNWKTIIPESKEVIESVGSAGGFLFVSYLKDASSMVIQYDLKGGRVRDIQLPGIGTVSGFGAKKEDNELFYSFTSFTQPATIFRFDVPSGKSDLFRRSEVRFNPEEFTTEQVFFTSKDGTKVPMFLSYKKGMIKNGNNPVLLYGYGGFNIPLTPAFSISNLFFMEQGGIYASVNLRGGNEYGETWHKAGMLDKKQNVFDDFIGAAEYLIKENYTKPSKLAIRGGSNGGLLVGACMTQRPELFKVALPAVGVMDMLRFQKFTVGFGWVVEYGSSDNARDFEWLYKYSPLHNLKKGVSYPATLVTTADHDDRVVPAHSFKFAATLQECHQGNNPVLIRIDVDAGHGAGKPTGKVIDEAADIWSFVMYNLGMEFK
ncbi:MAG: prolyl oligopeptidase family serine peptidase [Chitinophagaceae bacterium]|nr:prolyl oligopeptidase family serine peptidase [Chitinophagaceae bacterium]